MPRWASRLTLEITAIRVERVQDISDKNAEDEGIYNASGIHLADCSGQQFHPDQDCQCGDRTAQEDFRRLWDSINAKRGYGWDTNPWCWAITFLVVP